MQEGPFPTLASGDAAGTAVDSGPVPSAEGEEAEVTRVWVPSLWFSLSRSFDETAMPSILQGRVKESDYEATVRGINDIVFRTPSLWQSLFWWCFAGLALLDVFLIFQLPNMGEEDVYFIFTVDLVGLLLVLIIIVSVVQVRSSFPPSLPPRIRRFLDQELHPRTQLRKRIIQHLDEANAKLYNQQGINLRLAHRLREYLVIEVYLERGKQPVLIPFSSDDE